MIAGRDFTSADTPGRHRRDRQRGLRRAIHRRQEPDRHARPQPGQVRLIVGYMKDAVYESLRETVPPTLYMRYGQLTALPPPRRSASARARDRRSLTGRSRRPSPRSYRTQGHVQPAGGSLTGHADAGTARRHAVCVLWRAGACCSPGWGSTESRRTASAGAAPRWTAGARRPQRGIVMLVLRRAAILVGLGIFAGAGVSLWASRFLDRPCSSVWRRAIL